MFCPKCAAELLLQDGELTCPRGQMGISEHLRSILMDRYGKHRPSPKHGVVAIEPNAFYCPGCGVPLDAKMLCPECHLSLKDLGFPLVELHPHKRPTGGWR